jgi:diguanylate cyclase (GGDEF)-like protein
MANAMNALAGAWNRMIASKAMAVALGIEYKRRMRLLQWCMAGSMYVGSGLVMAAGLEEGWTNATLFAGWVAFVTIGLTASFAAIRTGWTERFRDPGLTTWQIVMGCLAVDWGYLMCGPLRTIALFPLALVLTFGAFALSWHRIMTLAAFALLGLLAGMAWLQWQPSLMGTWPRTAPPVDRINLGMMLVLMPTLAVMTARLSSLRRRLRQQRSHLSHELDEARQLAEVDTLTGLPNRRALMERLARFERGAAERGIEFAVTLLDIDHFKKVNDALGHATGDELLARFARAARESLRGGDVIGRWGGEEFLLLTHGGAEPAATAVIDRLQRATFALQVLNRPVTFSAGIAAHRAQDDVSQTIARADAAMYEAKQGGRDRVVVARG